MTTTFTSIQQTALAVWELRKLRNCLKLPEHLETNIEIFDYVTNGVHCSQQKNLCCRTKKTIQDTWWMDRWSCFPVQIKTRQLLGSFFCFQISMKGQPLFLLLLQIEVSFVGFQCCITRSWGVYLHPLCVLLIEYVLRGCCLQIQSWKMQHAPPSVVPKIF